MNPLPKWHIINKQQNYQQYISSLYSVSKSKSVVTGHIFILLSFFFFLFFFLSKSKQQSHPSILAQI
jgi:hypothetical protein